MIIIGIAGKPGTEEKKINIIDWCSDIFEESSFLNFTIPKDFKGLFVDKDGYYKMDKRMINCNMIISIEPKSEFICCKYQTYDFTYINDSKTITIGIMRVNEDCSEKSFKDDFQDIIELYLCENKIQVYTE